MTPKRKKVQDMILETVNKIDSSGTNNEYYTKLFNSLSDSEFDAYMKRIKDGKDQLPFYTANMKSNVTVETLLKVAKEKGIELFERIKMFDSVTKSYFLTPRKQLILQLPIRKQSQFVDHKLSVAEGDSRIDALTGQVVKPDQAGAVSQIEVQTLYARNLKNIIRELIKFRGGDVVAFSEFKRELEEQGSTSIGRETGSLVRSAVVLDVLFSGMHIESNASGV